MGPHHVTPSRDLCHFEYRTTLRGCYFIGRVRCIWPSHVAKMMYPLPSLSPAIGRVRAQGRIRARLVTI